MLKLKITTTVLALAALVLLLMGGTYFTTAAAIVCTAMAWPLAFHLTFRRFAEGPHDGLLWLWSVVWVIMSVLTAASMLQYIGAMDVPLSATIDNAQKMGDVGQYVSIANVASILLAVVVPRSPKRDDDDGDSDKG